jgi:nicotinate-nucleotide pyrophosphorylase
VIFKFGTFEFDDQIIELRKNGRITAIEPQPAKALALLLARAGDVISREELRDAVWGKDTHVDFDRGLAYCISQVRSAQRPSQPRNIRNLKAVAQSLDADYILLGQLQQGETGLRFITHFIRLADEAHLKANRLVMADGGVAGLEAAVVQEFERAVRQYLLNQSAN